MWIRNANAALPAVYTRDNKHGYFAYAWVEIDLVVLVCKTPVYMNISPKGCKTLYPYTKIYVFATRMNSGLKLTYTCSDCETVLKTTLYFGAGSGGTGGLGCGLCWAHPQSCSEG